MKVLLTGASGFIGRQALKILAASGADVIAVARAWPESIRHDGIEYVSANLLDPASRERLCREARASHLLHLAWEATPGQFWSSRSNADWVAAGIDLLTGFRQHGGERAVLAGTCAEYDWTAGSLSELNSPVAPATLYGVAKDAFRRIALKFAEQYGPSLAWGRIFWLYGPGEARGRLVSDVAVSLLHNVPIAVSEGSQRRDFLHVVDVASAFVRALQSSYEGVFNIGSGCAVPVRTMIDLVATHAGDSALLQRRPPGQPEISELQADVSILRDQIGFFPRYGLEAGVADTVAWWRQELAR